MAVYYSARAVRSASDECPLWWGLPAQISEVRVDKPWVGTKHAISLSRTLPTGLSSPQARDSRALHQTRSQSAPGWPLSIDITINGRFSYLAYRAR